MKIIKIDKRTENKEIVAFSCLKPTPWSNLGELERIRERIDTLEQLVLLLAEKTNDNDTWKFFADRASNHRVQYVVK